MSCPHPSTQISRKEADERIQLFLDNKMPILSNCIEYKPELSSVSYHPKGFQALLKKLDEVSYYDGVRIYFATYLYNPFDSDGALHIPEHPTDPNDNCIDNMGLIFVPTTEAYKVVDGQRVKYHRDDIGSCWIIKGEQVVTLRSPATAPGRQQDTASNWIGYYQHLKLDKLSANGRILTANDGFNDTKSIWYGKVDWGHRSDNKGLLDYVTCLIRDSNPLKEVIVKFAVYPFPNVTVDPIEDFRYQLTLIFHFKQADEPFQGAGNTFFTFLKADRKKEGILGDDTDTGNPCPPNTCDGSELPQP